VSTTPRAPAIAAPATRGQVLAWGLWDWGSSGYNTIVLTFVFSVYLTDAVGDDLPGAVSANSWLAWAIGAAGLVLALLAPVLGAPGGRGRPRRGPSECGRPRRSPRWPGSSPSATTTATWRSGWCCWPGIDLLRAGVGVLQRGAAPGVDPATIGRVSGFGWAMGYLGGIVLLLGSTWGSSPATGPTAGSSA
jgi:UMF1 family MFS transporter